MRQRPGGSVEGYLDSFRLSPDETLGVILDRDDEVAAVRWVLLHLIEKTARHAGHADIFRDALNGATAFPLLAAAEGWPATPWLQPWPRLAAGS